MSKKSRIKYLFVLILLIVPALSLAARHTLSGKIVHVVDGDTVDVRPVEGGQFFRCRLYGIDAPETAHRNKPGQPYGDEATRELKHLVLGKTVEITTTGAKTYNRDVCLISGNGMDVNLEMVKKGCAWAYRHYLRRPYASEYINAERQARVRKLGLWKEANPTPPWEFRRILRGR